MSVASGGQQWAAQGARRAGGPAPDLPPFAAPLRRRNGCVLTEAQWPWQPWQVGLCPWSESSVSLMT